MRSVTNAGSVRCEWDRGDPERASSVVEGGRGGAPDHSRGT